MRTSNNKQMKTTAAICTIGDEILIGQIIDTNSAFISQELGAIGVTVTTMVSIADNRSEIIGTLSDLLGRNDIVITTGGLGPTKDDITKDALRELFGAKGYVNDEEQAEIVHNILKSRGLDKLRGNVEQSMVPEGCKVIPNRLGTAPVMVFPFERTRYGHEPVLYSMPGVPFETENAMTDVISDIKSRKRSFNISHRNIMTYGIAESALSQLIEPWETSLPDDIHLAYLPNPLTGVRLRLSVSGDKNKQFQDERLQEQIDKLRPILGENMYSEQDDCLENTIKHLFSGSGETLSAAESCTGGMISHLITTIPGSSEYYLGSVTSYAVAVKEKVLGVPDETIRNNGVVSSEVAEAMAEGVRKLTGSTYSVATTGLAGPGGDDFNPEGTVWIGISGPMGAISKKFEFHSGRKRNIDRFAATALDLLRRYVLKCRNSRNS